MLFYTFGRRLDTFFMRDKEFQNSNTPEFQESVVAGGLLKTEEEAQGSLIQGWRVGEGGGSWWWYGGLRPSRRRNPPQFSVIHLLIPHLHCLYHMLLHFVTKHSQIFLVISLNNIALYLAAFKIVLQFKKKVASNCFAKLKKSGAQKFLQSSFLSVSVPVLCTIVWYYIGISVSSVTTISMYQQ